MKYPKRLLPQKYYRHRINDRDIPRRAVFIRWTKSNKRVKLLKNLKSNVKVHINPGHIYNGISCYLLSVMRKQDFKYDPSHEDEYGYDADWNEGEEAIVPDIDKISIIDNRGFFCIRKDKIYSFQPIIGINEQGKPPKPVKLCLKIEHEPTKTNYWHFDLHVWIVKKDSIKECRLKDALTGSENSKQKKFKKYMVGIMDDFSELMLPEKSAKPIYLTKSKYQKQIPNE